MYYLPCIVLKELDLLTFETINKASFFFFHEKQGSKILKL